MAGELKILNPELKHPEVKTDSSTVVAEQEAVASGEGGITLDSTFAMSSSGDATSSIKGETDQDSVAGQGVYCPPTSCYNYYYPGNNGVLSQLDDHGYYNADGSYTGIQSDNGSLVYYMPGYDQYSGGPLVGVDGQCHQPYFTSSGYLQPAVSYGSEVLPSYTWDSTFAGDASNGAKMMASSSINSPMRKNGMNSVNCNITKSSAMPPDSRTRQPAASSNFSKPTRHAQPFKPLNKVPYVGPEFQSVGLVKGLQPAGKFSSFSNQRQSLFRSSGPMNYRPDGWYRNDRYKMKEKSSRNVGFENSNELARGPRAQNSSTLSPSTKKEDLRLAFQKDLYNPPDFQIDYESGKFFVIKSYNEDDIHKCIKYSVWASTVTGNKKLDAAYREAESKMSQTSIKCPVFLFFSVNGSGQFLGLAEMTGPVDFNKDMNFWQADKWSGFFPVQWHVVKDIPNSQLRHIILENNDNRAVTYTRDTQEIGLKHGLEMLGIFKSYLPKTSILDDFNFYEDREKSLLAKRRNIPVSPETEVCSNNSLLKDFRAGDNKLNEESVRGNKVSDPAVGTLADLTKNLSLDARWPKNVASVPSVSPRKAL